MDRENYIDGWMDEWIDRSINNGIDYKIGKQITSYHIIA